MLRPSFALNFPPSDQRAQGRPGARCTRGLVCKVHKRRRTRAYRFSGGNPAFPARWFYGFLRALPGDRLSCHRRHADRSTRLDASIGASGPHDFAVRRISTLVSSATCVHASHRAFRDDREPPLLPGETGGFKSLICPTAKAEYFFGEDWTGQISFEMVREIRFCAQA
jgi:hypothetical protein